MKSPRLEQPEYRLLAECARGHLSEHWQTELQQLDWPTVDRIAYQQRLGAELAAQLGKAGLSEHVPEALWNALDKSYRANTLRNLSFKARLRNVLSTLHSASVPVILLKGAALGELVYPDIGSRITMDLDLLVKGEDIQAAYELLRNQGYRRAWKDDTPNDENRHFPRLLGPTDDLPVELHHHLVNRRDRSFDINDWWDDAEPITFAGIETLILAPERQIIHLCLHFFSDARARFPGSAALRKLGDIARVLDHYGEKIDWELLERLTRHDNTEAVVKASLEVVRRVMRPEILDSGFGHALADDRGSTNVSLLVEHRVFREGIWFFYDLVDPWDVSTGNEIRSALKRLTQPDDHYQRLGLSLQQRWRRHLADLGDMLLGYLKNPGRLRADLAVNRWMTTIYNEQFKSRAQSADLA